MPKKKARKKTTKPRKTKPIGFVKEGKKFKLVFGTKSKPRLGRTSFSSKSNLLKKARTLLKK